MSVFNAPPPTDTVRIDRPAMALPVAVLVLLNAADVVLTRIGLARGAVEANPLARALLGGGRVELAKLALLLLLTLRVQQRRPTLRFAVACWVAAGAYAMVVASNVWVIWALASH